MRPRIGTVVRPRGYRLRPMWYDVDAKQRAAEASPEPWPWDKKELREKRRAEVIERLFVPTADMDAFSEEDAARLDWAFEDYSMDPT